MVTVLFVVFQTVSG